MRFTMPRLGAVLLLSGLFVACGGKSQPAEEPDTSEELGEAADAVGEEVEGAAEEVSEGVSDGAEEVSEETDEIPENRR